MIDLHRYTLERERLYEPDEIFEKFMINSDDHVQFSYSRFLSQFIEFHSALMKSRIIVGISDLKFDRLSWIIDRPELIDTLGRWSIPS